MPAPPSQADLEALAERALALLDGEGQVTAWWERTARSERGRLRLSEAVRVEFAALGPGATGVVEVDGGDGDALGRAAAAAVRLGSETRAHARAGRALPEPAAGRTHDGYDVGAAGVDAAKAAAAAVLPGSTRWRAGAAKVAVASSRGVRAYEQRSFGALGLGMAGQRQSFVRAAATGPAGLDVEALSADALAFSGDREAVAGTPAAPGEHGVVLGPWAVAALLESAASAFGGASGSAFARALGTRVVAPCINLSDSPRFGRTLPRSYDAEGAPVQPTPLIQDGVAHRVVHDATSAAQAGVTTTGHATAPGGSGNPRPSNFVLVGGGAADVAELAAGLGDGLVITSLVPRGRDRFLAYGVRRIAGGELAEPLPHALLEADLFAVLAATHALTARQWLVPARRLESARTAYGAVVPALRAAAGVRVTGVRS